MAIQNVRIFRITPFSSDKTTVKRWRKNNENKTKQKIGKSGTHHNRIQYRYFFPLVLWSAVLKIVV